MTWTDERVETLKRMWHENKLASEIGIAVGGKAADAVYRKASRLGLSRRQRPTAGVTLWPAERTAELKRLWGEGKSAREVGALLGVTKNAVIGRANRLGLLKGKPKPHEQAPESTVRTCQFPLWQDVVTHEFCGAPVKPGSPYCDSHHTRCYYKPTEAEREKKRMNRVASNRKIGRATSHVILEF